MPARFIFHWLILENWSTGFKVWFGQLPVRGTIVRWLRVVAWWGWGPGFNPSYVSMFFLSSGIRWKNDNLPILNCSVSVHSDKTDRYSSLPGTRLRLIPGNVLNAKHVLSKPQSYLFKYVLWKLHLSRQRSWVQVPSVTSFISMQHISCPWTNLLRNKI